MMADRFGKLPTELLSQSPGEFYVNWQIMLHASQPKGRAPSEPPKKRLPGDQTIRHLMTALKGAHG